MFKELILATIIGAILGLGVTGGYMTIQHKTEPPKEKSVIIEPTLIPTTTDNNPNTDDSSKLSKEIIINSPEPNSLLSSEKTSIIGTTTKNSHIVVITSTNSFIGQSDDQGNFQIPITLESGLNIIKITSLDQENNQKDTSINITYSTAKI